MNYRYLGKTGLKVGELRLDAMPFGREADKAADFQRQDRFAESGGHFLDAANITIIANAASNCL